MGREETQHQRLLEQEELLASVDSQCKKTSDHLGLLRSEFESHCTASGATPGMFSFKHCLPARCSCLLNLGPSSFTHWTPFFIDGSPLLRVPDNRHHTLCAQVFCHSRQALALLRTMHTPCLYCSIHSITLSYTLPAVHDTERQSSTIGRPLSCLQLDIICILQA